MPSDQRTHKFGVLGPSIAVLRFSVWGSVGHLGTSLHKASPKTPSILGPNEAAWKPCSEPSTLNPKLSHAYRNP